MGIRWRRNADDEAYSIWKGKNASDASVSQEHEIGYIELTDKILVGQSTKCFQNGLR
jgi:hypothetical protein